MSGRAAYQHSDGVLGGNHAECIEEVQATELPPAIVELSNEYDRRVGDRDVFLWKWIHTLFDAFTLPCVPSEAWEEVKEAKTVFTMFITVLDDVADRSGDGATFEQARRIPYSPESVDSEAPGVDTEVVEFAAKLWDDVNERLTDAPCYEEHLDVFRFDIRQALNAMEYARVVNDNKDIANMAESRHHGPFNMVMFPYAGMDLMWTPDFDRNELGELRNLLLDLQKMARIGNWVTTWERELFENDYTAGVVVEALDENIITTDDDPENAIAAINEHEVVDQFEEEWERRYREVSARDYGIDSFDADTLVRGMRTVMEFHLGSYGQK
ncbi:hypothetical protein [Halogeometricum limi]|uniref:Uncharacterized protein n=1 Tax=Halogeometricum limi TaxID=555875 RepID=A0A1I6IJ10_9EURY|nr:hypothetical protein [Halogeometricum limi]SFR66706.1 hypothetical protein SAMN04488124_3275 [Halogeometricum limi]